MSGPTKNFRFGRTWQAVAEIIGDDLLPHHIRLAIMDALTERDTHLEDYLSALPIRAWHVETAFVTDAGGRFVFPHGLTRTPVGIVASSMGPDTGATALGSVIVTAITATTFTARFFTPAGAALNATGGLAFCWIALG